MMPEHTSAATVQVTAPGDSATDPHATLDLQVAEIRQLYNAMDPAPFRERELDPNAVTYIVNWARETRADQPLRLLVQVTREPATPADASTLDDAVHAYFRHRAQATRQQLRQLFRVGRISLVIGLAFLACAIALGEFVASLVSKENYASIIKESFVIGGWVALWRPLEIFLYDWWPIRAEAKLHDRLGEMDVRLTGDTMVTRAMP